MKLSDKVNNINSQIGLVREALNLPESATIDDIVSSIGGGISVDVDRFYLFNSIEERDESTENFNEGDICIVLSETEIPIGRDSKLHTVKYKESFTLDSAITTNYGSIVFGNSITGRFNFYVGKTMVYIEYSRTGRSATVEYATTNGLNYTISIISDPYNLVDQENKTITHDYSRDLTYTSGSIDSAAGVINKYRPYEYN